MQPSANSHPVPEDLLAYGDGAVGEDVIAHVRACFVCQRTAAELVSTQDALRRTLFRIDCPDALRLGEYQLDLLDASQRRQVASHAADCNQCSAELQMLRAYLATPTRVPDSLGERARRVIASALKPAPGLAYGGVRGSAETATRVFEAQAVTVSVGPGAQPSSLVGLVVVPSAASEDLLGREVRLIRSDGAVFATLLDDLGGFEYDDLHSGVYALELDLTDTLIVVEELRVDVVR